MLSRLLRIKTISCTIYRLFEVGSEKVIFLQKKILILQPIGSKRPAGPRGLKGNRVKIPDSPAAVKLRQPLEFYTPLIAISGRPRVGSQSEDLPSVFVFNRARGQDG